MSNVWLTLTVAIDFLKACGGVANVKERMNLAQVIQMHLPNNFIYFDFINYFVSAVAGKTKYRCDSCTRLLSNFATVSDEAFAILSFENNFETWMDMGITGDTKMSTVPQKYTNGGNSLCKNATS